MTSEPEIVEESKPGSFFSNLSGVYFSPGDTFKGFTSRVGLLAPAIGLVLLGAVIGYLIFSRVDFTQIITPAIEAAVEKGQIAKEQAPNMIAMQAKFAKYGSLVGGLLGNIIFGLIIAGVFKLVSMVLSKENTFRSLLAVTWYSQLAVGIISSILFAVVMFIKGSDFDIQNPIGSNLGAVLGMMFDKDALPKFVWSLAKSVDVFYIWMIALLSIGYAAVSRKMKTSTAAGALIVLYLGLSVLGAVFAQFSGR